MKPKRLDNKRASHACRKPAGTFWRIRRREFIPRIELARWNWNLIVGRGESFRKDVCLPGARLDGNIAGVNEAGKSQEEQVGISPAVEPQRSAAGARALLMRAGEWLQRPPGNRMGLITTAVVVVLMYLLVLLGSFFL